MMKNADVKWAAKRIQLSISLFLAVLRCVHSTRGDWWFKQLKKNQDNKERTKCKWEWKIWMFSRTRFGMQKKQKENAHFQTSRKFSMQKWAIQSQQNAKAKRKNYLRKLKNWNLFVRCTSFHVFCYFLACERWMRKSSMLRAQNRLEHRKKCSQKNWIRALSKTLRRHFDVMTKQIRFQSIDKYLKVLTCLKSVCKLPFVRQSAESTKLETKNREYLR